MKIPSLFFPKDMRVKVWKNVFLAVLKKPSKKTSWILIQMQTTSKI